MWLALIYQTCEKCMLEYVLCINDQKVNWKYTADFMVIGMLFTVHVHS